MDEPLPIDPEIWERAQRKRAQFFGVTLPTTTKPTTAEGEAYRAKIARLNQHQPTQLDAILSRIEVRQVPNRPQLLDHETACTVILKIYQTELSRRGKQIAFTDEQYDVLDNLTRYFNADPTSPYDLHKGIFLYGHVGVGKTFLFDIMARFCKVVPIDAMRFRTVEAKALVADCNIKKSLAPIEAATKGHILYDDLGDEKLEITIYGKDEAQTYNPTDLLISARVSPFVRDGQLTHFTSNIQLHEEEGLSGIEARYGTRLYDRISEMCTAVYLPGTSKRQ